MNDLIINEIDHSKFDLEWAKRGGVLASLESENTRINMFKFLRSITAEKIEVSTISQLCFVKNFYEYRRVFRMATPDECAEAGIEYIEPPARWLPINTLTTDIPVPLIVCDKKSKQRGVLTGENIFGGACISGWNDDNITPTHWMPLPQPPKDE